MMVLAWDLAWTYKTWNFTCLPPVSNYLKNPKKMLKMARSYFLKFTLKMANASTLLCLPGALISICRNFAAKFNNTGIFHGSSSLNATINFFLLFRQNSLIVKSSFDVKNIFGKLQYFFCVFLHQNIKNNWHSNKQTPTKISIGETGAKWEAGKNENSFLFKKKLKFSGKILVKRNFKIFPHFSQVRFPKKSTEKFWLSKVWFWPKNLIIFSKSHSWK